jgi:hypothetical protein
MWKSRACVRGLLKKYTEMFSAKAETFSDLETQQKVKKTMHYEEIDLNFDASCQQILGLESKILWEAGRSPTLNKHNFNWMDSFVRPVLQGAKFNLA